jgi:beta-lactamase regulating signal transducer with metallopeptidase domain
MHLLTNEWASLAWMQLWQVTALAVAVFAVARLIARRRPHLAHVLWMLVIAKCLTPPIWASPLGVFSVVQSPTAATRVATESAGPSNPLQSPFADIEPMMAVVEAPGLAKVGRMERATQNVPAALDLRPIAIRALGGLWLIGALGVVVVIVCKWVSLGRRLRRTSLPADSVIADRVRTLARLLSVRSNPRLIVLTDKARSHALS